MSDSACYALHETSDDKIRPVIEMTIPSVVDRSLVEGDESSHVVSLFTQYTPYQLKDGPWTEERKEAYARHGAILGRG